MQRQPGDQRLSYLSDRYSYYPNGAAGGQPAPINGQPAAGVPGPNGGAVQAPPGGYRSPGHVQGARPPPSGQPAAPGSYHGYMPQAYQYQPAQPAAQQPAAQSYGRGQYQYAQPSAQAMSGQPAAMYGYANAYNGQPSANMGYGYNQPAAGMGYGYGQPAAGGDPMGVNHQQASPAADEDRIVAALQSVFPEASLPTLRTAVRVRHTFQAAADWLNSMKRQGMMGGASTATTKREVERTGMSIREKFARPQMPATGPLVGHTPPPSLQPKKKLARKFDDEFSGSDDSDGEEVYDQRGQYEFELRVLQFLNTAPQESIIDVTGCTEDMADVLIKKRPYQTLAQASKVDVPNPNAPTDGKRRRGAVKKSAGSKIVDASLSTLRGYEAVDSLIQECAKLGKDVQRGIRAWGVDIKGQDESELEITDVEGAGGFFKEKPALLAPDVELKNYQQVGINWLQLLYQRGLSCILADEMGLGKTCQVISFLAHLKETGQRGPHLVVCPSSTLENWLRELNRFCPALSVEPYYGSQSERLEIREAILAAGSNFDVMVTTYNLATGAKQDMGFLKSMRFNVCVYDEGHLLKNSQSERYNKLMKLRANFRVLLTGTPLQNNLRELVSLLSFILPNLFEQNKEDLLEVFKFKAKTSAGDQKEEKSSEQTRSQLLSEQRIIKAKTMMTPFVLRRRKDQVLQHLPPKSHEVVRCNMTERQRKVYNEELNRNRSSIKEANAEVKEGAKEEKSSRKTKQASIALDNVLMQLRKAALHPLLFRRLYDDKKLRLMSKEIMNEEVYKDANREYIFEDMQVMNDFELHNLCLKFPVTIGQHRLPEDEFLASGKVRQLQELIVPMKKRGDRLLIFSQFTQVLDILERVLTKMEFSFLRMDGQTPVELRQDMIDKYYAEEDITVFLLSTKAGGFGINLACANVVIIFDLSFNPHDDKQAEDRAHRVGQTRPVKVVRMVTRDSIEESIMQLANTKLALDRHVSEENDEVDPESEALVADLVLENAPTTASSRLQTPAPGSPSDSELDSSGEVSDDEENHADGEAAPNKLLVTLKYKA